MRTIQLLLLLIAITGGSIASTQPATTGDTDSTSAQVVMSEQTLKKQVVVPRPKTNWSKLKELFM